MSVWSKLKASHAMQAALNKQAHHGFYSMTDAFLAVSKSFSLLLLLLPWLTDWLHELAPIWLPRPLERSIWEWCFISDTRQIEKDFFYSLSLNSRVSSVLNTSVENCVIFTIQYRLHPAKQKVEKLALNFIEWFSLGWQKDWFLCYQRENNFYWSWAFL